MAELYTADDIIVLCRRFPGVDSKPDTVLKAFPRIGFQISIKGEVEMEYRIVKKEAFRIVGVREPIHVEPKPEGKTDFDPADVEESFLYGRYGVTQSDVKCNSYELLTEEQWAALFSEAGLELIKTASDKDAAIPASGDSDIGMAFVTARANELTQKHPDKKAIFEGYVRGQQNEYDDIENTIICVTWMLRKA